MIRMNLDILKFRLFKPYQILYIPSGTIWPKSYYLKYNAIRQVRHIIKVLTAYRKAEHESPDMPLECEFEIF